MQKIKNAIPIILLFLSLLTSSKVNGQQSSDDLFQEARKQAFDLKNYARAIQLSREALGQSPGYTDIEVFLGRLYTWTNKADSARNTFEHVLLLKPENEDAWLAYASLEYWNNDSPKALSLTEKGLSANPGSHELLLLEAKILQDLNRYKEAYAVASKLLKLDPKNTGARALAERIKENSSRDKIGLNYEFVHFDKQFNDPWHLASIDYGRQTRYGSITGRLNYANRFATNGTQAELEVYPKISRTFYAYVSGAYSGNVGVFPKYRAGFSLYANLPKAFEAEAGVRYLHFSDNTTIYTFAAGKYISNYWINLRTYLTPSASNISQSYSVNLRYYYGSADDYIGFGLGTGISPDETANTVLYNASYKLISNNFSASYRHLFTHGNVITLSASWLNQEYSSVNSAGRTTSRGNQVNLSLGYQKRF